MENPPSVFPPPSLDPNLNPPESPKLGAGFGSGLHPGFGVSQAKHWVLSAGFEIMQTSHDQVPVFGLNMEDRSPLGAESNAWIHGYIISYFRNIDEHRSNSNSSLEA